MYDLVNLYHDVLDAMDARGSASSDSVSADGSRPNSPAGGRNRAGWCWSIPSASRSAGGKSATSCISSIPTPRSWTGAHGTTRRAGRMGSYGLGWHATIGDAMSDAEMITLARNWDSPCLYGWKPHMFNPQLAAVAAPDRGADARAVGRIRPHRDPGIRQSYAAADPRCRVPADRGGRAPPGTRAAPGICRGGYRVC